MKHSLHANMVFLGQFLRSPARVGSLCPSSGYLVRALADMALSCGSKEGLIVDLGAGSGVVSAELLRRGIEPGRILGVDISGDFGPIFHKSCPDVELVIGDARSLAAIVSCRASSCRVQAVISSLPLRNMPLAAVGEIMLEAARILRRSGGHLIQYTYVLWLHSFLEQFGFQAIEKRYVAANLPPALVEAYTPVS